MRFFSEFMKFISKGVKTIYKMFRNYSKASKEIATGS